MAQQDPVELEPVTYTPDSNHAGVTNFGGFALYEDAGAAAQVNLRREVVGGTIIMPLQFQANEFKVLMLDRNIYLDTPDGVYAEEASGSLTGVLYNKA